MTFAKDKLFRCRLTDAGLELINTHRKGGSERFAKAAARLGFAYKTASYTHVKWDDCRSYAAYADNFIQEVRQ